MGRLGGRRERRRGREGRWSEGGEGGERGGQADQNVAFVVKQGEFGNTGLMAERKEPGANEIPVKIDPGDTKEGTVRRTEDCAAREVKGGFEGVLVRRPPDEALLLKGLEVPRTLARIVGRGDVATSGEDHSKAIVESQGRPRQGLGFDGIGTSKGRSGSAFREENAGEMVTEREETSDLGLGLIKRGFGSEMPNGLRETDAGLVGRDKNKVAGSF